MVIFVMKVLVLWSLVDLVLGCVLGAAIRKGEQLHKDAVLTDIFDALSNLQASR